MIRRIEVSGDIDFSMSINEGINIIALEEGKTLMTDILELYRHLRMRNLQSYLVMNPKWNNFNNISLYIQDDENIYGEYRADLVNKDHTLKIKKEGDNTYDEPCYESELMCHSVAIGIYDFIETNFDYRYLDDMQLLYKSGSNFMAVLYYYRQQHKDIYNNIMQLMNDKFNIELELLDGVEEGFIVNKLRDYHMKGSVLKTLNILCALYNPFSTMVIIDNAFDLLSLKAIKMLDEELCKIDKQVILLCRPHAVKGLQLKNMITDTEEMLRYAVTVNNQQLRV